MRCQMSDDDVSFNHTFCEQLCPQLYIFKHKQSGYKNPNEFYLVVLLSVICCLKLALFPYLYNIPLIPYKFSSYG